MAPCPFAAMAVAAVAVLHLVIIAPFHPVVAPVLPVLPAVIVLSTHCQTGNRKNHQESEHYGSF